MNKETALALDQRTIKISDFVSARASEITSFTSILKTKLANLNKLPFQLLPKHMRRRAMSHNKYRIPSRIRNKIREEDLLLKKPSHSRKHLRRAKLLLSNYARRSARSKWLETHLWHAKRMSMKEYFGYNVADTCRSKSTRAAYRYFKTDCLLYDLSYYFIFELKAQTKQRIVDLLSLFVDQSSKEWSQFCKNKEIEQGSRKGFINLYTQTEPKRLLQRCEYIVRPNATENSHYQVWFFMHPSSRGSLDLVLKDASVNFEGIWYKLYEANFNIYHLIGPTTCSKLFWLFQNIAANQEELESCKEAQLIKVMKTIEDPGAYPRKMVVHLSFDQRKVAKLLNKPKEILGYQENSLIEEQEVFNDLIVELASYKHTPSAEAGNLELWEHPEVPEDDEHSIRFKEVTRGRFTHKKKEYLRMEEEKKKKLKKPNNKKQKGKKEQTPQPEASGKDLLAAAAEDNPDFKAFMEEVQGQACAANENKIEEEEKAPIAKDTRIELILIHDEGESQTCEGAGFKVIVPCGKGLFVWRFLNYLGCKALGMKEYLQVLNERRDFIFPNDLPHSTGYQLFQKNLKEERLKKYFNKPPAKRINFIKIRSPYAFASEWETVLSQYLENLNPKPIQEISLIGQLIPVYIKMVRRRYPVDLATICIPTNEDLELIIESEKKAKQGPDIVHTDPMEKCDFQKPLKKITVEEYQDKLKTVISSRKIGGFITTGYFSYRFGTGCGKGHIFRTVLEELKPFEVKVSNKKDGFENSLSFNSCFYMLVKNPSSRYFYACKIYLLNP